GRVVDRVERILAALRLDRLTPRIRPHDQRHPEPLGIRTDRLVLREVGFLRRRSDVQRVAYRVSPEPYGVLDGCVDGGQRGRVGRDVGLTVQLQDQRYLTGILPKELLG